MLEFRATDYTTSPDGKTVFGHAIVVNKPSVIAGAFIETIAPGSFTETIAVDDIRCLLNHNDDYVLGRSTSGTLKLSVDDVGLACELSLSDTGIGDYVSKAIARGDLQGWSFGFYVTEESWIDNGYSIPERTVLKMTLSEVSICGDPQYLDTDIGVRASIAPTTTRNHMARTAMRLKLLERIEH